MAYYSNEYCNNIRIQLVQNKILLREIRSQNENFVFDEVPYGMYDIIFRINDDIAHTIKDLKVDASTPANLRFDGIFRRETNISYNDTIDYRCYPYMFYNTSFTRNCAEMYVVLLKDSINVTVKRFTLDGNLIQEKTEFFTRIRDFLPLWYDTNPNDILPTYYVPELIYVTHEVDGKKYFC